MAPQYAFLGPSSDMHFTLPLAAFLARSPIITGALSANAAGINKIKQYTQHKQRRSCTQTHQARWMSPSLGNNISYIAHKSTKFIIWHTRSKAVSNADASSPSEGRSVVRIRTSFDLSFCIKYH
jgi:hypothetical protein